MESSPNAPDLPRFLGVRLSLMFFVEVAVLAGYFPLLSLHLSRGLGLPPGQIALVYAVLPLTALVGPPLIGFVADRVFAAERSLALLGVARSALLVLAAHAQSFGEILLAMTLLGFLTAPANVLTFSIAFRHLPDPRGIGRARVWGTVGWMCMLWLVGTFMTSLGGVNAQLSHTHTTFYFSASLALLGSIYALTLPHTPPLPRTSSAFVFVEALGLLRDKSYLALIVGAMLSAACLQFHFMSWPLFSTDAKAGLGLDLADASRFATVSQLPELLLFPALGLMIHRFGLRGLLIVGLLAWPLRFALHALGRPVALVVAAQALHGVSVVCGTVVAQIAVDRVAPRGARASSQALLTTATAGAGSLLGQLLCGASLAAGSLQGGGYAWPAMFAVPLALGLLATGVVASAFHPERGRDPLTPLPVDDEPPSVRPSVV